MLESNILYVHRFLTSLVFTDVIETMVLILLVRFVLRNHAIQIRQMLFAGLYASFSTIPYVWFIFPFLLVWPLNVFILFAEAFAFIVEAILYRVLLKLDWKWAFLVSFVCNLVSYVLGPILRAHGIWLYW